MTSIEIRAVYLFSAHEGGLITEPIVLLSNEKQKGDKLFITYLLVTPVGLEPTTQ